MRASILAVGTELTTGQITNRNAPWIAEKLDALGAPAVLHHVVPDDRVLIREALDTLATHTDLIFVTGGLGPTSDDFTREVLAEWAGKPLEFHEPSWQHIEARLTRAGIPIAPSNRQQCFYPQGARVLENSEGTANAFTFTHDFKGRSVRLWALPGPPREIEAVWASGIATPLAEIVPESDRTDLKLWQLIGKSEAEVGELTEAALAGSNLAIGYRVHRPYCEVKVWIPQKRAAECAPAIERLEKALAPWIVARGKPDFAGDLLKELDRGEEVVIIDHLSFGIVGERILGAFRERRAIAGPAALATPGLIVHASTQTHATAEGTETAVRAELEGADPESLTLVIAGFSPDGTWCLGMRSEDRLHVVRHSVPFRGPTMIDRSRRYAVEIALLHWRDWLREGVN